MLGQLPSQHCLYSCSFRCSFKLKETRDPLDYKCNSTNLAQFETIHPGVSLAHSRGGSSVGRPSASQTECRGFKSLRPLLKPGLNSCFIWCSTQGNPKAPNGTAIADLPADPICEPTRQRKQSSAASASSSRALSIRCRTMTAIHRSGRCDKRHIKSRRGCRMEPFRSLPLREHRRGQGSRRKPLRGEGESPMNHNVARHSYCSTALLHLSHETAA